MPDVLRLAMKDEADDDVAPERDKKIRFRAPWATSHWDILRPRPPRPPARRYDALGSREIEGSGRWATLSC